MTYTRAQANWQNDAIGGTPINRIALNTIEAGIVNVDGRLTTAEGAYTPKTLVDAKGDLIVGTADNVIARLGVGTDGQVLTAASAQTSGLLWSTPSGGGAVTSVAGRTGAVTLTSSDVGLGSVANSLAVPQSLVTAKGDLLAATASSTVARLAVGADAQVLTADSTQTAGVKWATPTAGGSGIPASTATTKGDLLAASAASTVTRLGVGTDGQTLIADSTQALGIKWANDPDIPTATVTTKGDLLAATASNVVARLGVGTNGQLLIADSTQTAGIKWGVLAPGSAGAGHIIKDEGTSLTNRGTLNFVGAGVTATDDAANAQTVVTIPGGGSSSVPLSTVVNLGDLIVGTGTSTVTRLGVSFTDGDVLTADSTAAATGMSWTTPAVYKTVQDEGLGLTQRSVINFVGSGVIATDDGGGLRTQVKIAGFSASVTLTDAATIATDAGLGSYFRVTLAGNRTLGAPTNLSDGQIITWELIQDATGSRTITLNGIFALGTTVGSVTLTTTASKRDFLTGIYNSTTTKIYCTQFVKGY